MTGPTTGSERAGALQAALAVLACPLCLARMRRDGGALVCEQGHRHDVARQGYASLAAGSGARGDTVAMVAARSAFLRTGHFAGVERAVARTVPADARWCVDLAGGTGHHLARVLEQRPDARGIALDVSVPAARAAAGAHPRLASATADVWRRLPVRDGAADHLLDVFGPRNGPEFARILAPADALTVVTPLPGHLAELRAPFGTMGIAAGKQQRVDDRLAPLVRAATEHLVEHRAFSPRDAADAVLMGPNGHHLAAADVEAVAARLVPVEVTIAVEVAVYRHASSISEADLGR